jgi:hypothetical protein
MLPPDGRLFLPKRQLVRPPGGLLGLSCRHNFLLPTIILPRLTTRLILRSGRSGCHAQRQRYRYQDRRRFFSEMLYDYHFLFQLPVPKRSSGR